MANKSFGLEQVLKYRKEVEKARKLEFTAAQQEIEGACERLKDEESRVDRLNAEFLYRQREGTTAMELQIYSDFFRRKILDINRQRQETATLNDMMTEKRYILIEAAMEKKVLETLKEKKAKAHMRELLDKERTFLEEIALRKKGHGK